MTTIPENIWIIGCGDIGLRVARLYIPNTDKINGIVRSQDSARLCKQAGIVAKIVDLDVGDLPDPDKFKDALIYYFAPPPGRATDTRIERFLKLIGDSARRIVMISTTGVYGNQNGAWVEETTPTKPATDRARRRLSAENTLKIWADKYNKEYIILRVPGIYASDRLPLKRLKKRLPIVRESEAPWTNRIHADDLAMICKAAMNSKMSNTIYNVTDGQPGTMTDYFNQIADYAGLPRPPQITLKQAIETLSPGMASYLKESRRISNRKMLKELSITLQYPTLAEGLKK